MKKTRFSEAEYRETGKKIKAIHADCLDLFHLVNGHFPKNSATIRQALKVTELLSFLYYDVEHEYFKDFPEKELKDFGK